MPGHKCYRGLGMKRPTTKPEIRTWRASLIKQRAEFLGRVEAPDREAAEAAAVEKFRLTDEQRKRLVLQEQRGDGGLRLCSTARPPTEAAGSPGRRQCRPESRST
jgi:hypothetical protein